MNGLLQPIELSKICKINKSTLNGYLNDHEAFPPAKIDENNNYRYYDKSTIDKLNLMKLLRKRPFRLKISEAKRLLISANLIEIIEYSKISSDALFRYLRNNSHI